MADKFEQLSDRHISFIEAQKMFFVGTAPRSGRINLSPKGLDSLRVLDETCIAWLNLTGSGNETAAHVLENGRMTLMFCGFEKQPMILRVYGAAQMIYPRDEEWSSLQPMFPEYLGARQIFKLQIDLVQTSCGFAVPYYEFAGDRPTLASWSEKRGDAGIRDYWQEKNRYSLDNLGTGIQTDGLDPDCLK